MEGHQAGVDVALFGVRLGATLFFVLLNGFFVAAEFSLVKVRSTRIEDLAEAGGRRALVVRNILANLDRYLSACQLGITVASLILGWLAEPAIAELLLVGAAAAGLDVNADGPLLHALALTIALTIVTVLHMTIGEQAPKIWAIHRPESIALAVARPLRIFAAAFRPFIWVINELSNALLRVTGLASGKLQDSSIHDTDEIKRILASSAQSGHLTGRQLALAQNVIDIIELEVRHIMVPRVDVTYLTLQNDVEANLEVIRSSGHSRFPLCSFGLDSVIGIIHAKDIMGARAEGVEQPDLQRMARKPIFVSDTQSVSRLIFQLQRSRNHCCVVLDEHGTTIGLAFLEDALEEIVGPIRDEFDDEVDEEIRRLSNGVFELSGSLALPEAEDVLELPELEDDADTIGGLFVAQLGRLPRKGDVLQIGQYRASVVSVKHRRIDWLRFEPIGPVPQPAGP